MQNLRVLPQYEVEPFVQWILCLQMKGLELIWGFLIMVFCPGLPQLFYICCHISPFFFARDCYLDILRKMIQTSCNHASRVSDITLELLTLNFFWKVCNNNRPWKVLLQLIPKPYQICLQSQTLPLHGTIQSDWCYHNTWQHGGQLVFFITAPLKHSQTICCRKSLKKLVGFDMHERFIVVL